MVKVCFIDRDDTLIRASKSGVQLYSEPHNVELMPGVVEGLELIVKSGYLPIVASNQPGIGLEKTTEKNVRLTNALINDKLWSMGSPGILMFKHCPHIPNTGCRCRKPGPGLAFEVRDALGADLANSIMIGDSQSDVEFADTSGLKGCWRIRVGRKYLAAEVHDRLVPVSMHQDFFEAAKFATEER
jgi:histidinol-phosphate phosphatase family protein